MNDDFDICSLNFPTDIIDETNLVDDYEDPAAALAQCYTGIQELLERAHWILRNHASESINGRARGYWYAHIAIALDNRSEFMGRSMCTMEDTVRELWEANHQDCSDDPEDFDDSED